MSDRLTTGSKLNKNTFNKDQTKVPIVDQVNKLGALQTTKTHLLDISNELLNRPESQHNKYQNLILTLFVRQICKCFSIYIASNFIFIVSKLSPDEHGSYEKYRIESDIELPCKLKPNEISERFGTICKYQKKNEAECCSFEKYRIPNRHEVLSSNVFDSDNARYERVSIWNGLHSNEECFLYSDLNSTEPKLRRMHSISKHMEYGNACSENNSFEELFTFDFTVPHYFSKFYV